jgi:hypothetical protein
MEFKLDSLGRPWVHMPNEDGRTFGPAMPCKPDMLAYAIGMGYRQTNPPDAKPDPVEMVMPEPVIRKKPGPKPRVMNA